MKFNTAPAAAVLYALILVSSARDVKGKWTWTVCGLQTWCGSNDDCRSSEDCLNKAFGHSPDLIFCWVNAFHPYTCWAWTGPSVDGGSQTGS
ncbi:hypothetical protein PAAG_08311 [Paracoccidioides lutzii Pb01]|uniref:Extracellular membrane protein CFEM domain-containing protein n=1 Tax=Paracoccidioides lutzii (strain ATCC MYA-826 / Pb01) TaxID=502779 RepID=C1HC20_PARBA|nr:hypothetical protein PAAG_08311 [Paracoccidioides lutzii Pb01]EEH38584.1 hypothetical protein PAAG_08311 [Paracoccidioides lutzii Pb01]